MSNKRERVDLGLNAKMEILQLLDSKCKRPDIANQFGIDVPGARALSTLTN